ncbi:MAG: preprotein translocase subunit SecG [Methylobacteriaceae bacterium]|jgi:preprotein translocase subunit SecG|nr:preprotein translocase subunit SecG [Methylobacteriaceae bacterium]
MQTVLIVVHLMVVIGLIVTVLLQRSEGGALGIGGGGGTGGLFTGRGQANVLTRATAILAAIFFVTSIALTVLASYGRAPKSIFEGVTPPGPTAPAGQPASGGGVLDQLKQLQQSPAGPPAAPAAPEPPRSQ